MTASQVISHIDDFPPNTRKVVEVNGRSVVVFRVEDEFYALLNRCPHEGAELCKGRLGGLVVSSEPGEYDMTQENQFLRCPWHGWEFDIKTGQSYCDPRKTRTPRYDVAVKSGGALQEGPYKAEPIKVSLDDLYVVVHC
ncbi:MAG: 2Fe-2S ferredoxin [Rhizobiales bacterium 62-17]|nr:Rieske (2Fe-2S) protein [Hyphomicrobiales bacterium]OJX99786.1 MAG: 2Fe-2S ferredoxin [Rhizobiales bacterium 62-17]